jgi:hypothetical protein
VGTEIEEMGGEWEPRLVTLPHPPEPLIGWRWVCSRQIFRGWYLVMSQRMAGAGSEDKRRMTGTRTQLQCVVKHPALSVWVSLLTLKWSLGVFPDLNFCEASMNVFRRPL